MPRISSNTKRRLTILITIITLVIASGLGSYLYLSRDTGPIPAPIRSQLSFSPFIIPNNKHFTVTDYKFNTAEGTVPILSYVVHTKNGVTVAVSQYPQPQEFSEIPEYKTRFLTNVAKQYATVQTASGTIYLGRMALQDNQQLGVMLEKGLLVFMKPSSELDEVTWRQLGEQFEITKIAD